MQAGFYDSQMQVADDESRDLKKLAKRIRETRKLGILESRINKTHKRTPSLARPDKKVPRSRLEKTMESLGLDMSDKKDVKYLLIFMLNFSIFKNHFVILIIKRPTIIKVWHVVNHINQSNVQEKTQKVLYEVALKLAEINLALETKKWHLKLETCPKNHSVNYSTEMLNEVKLIVVLRVKNRNIYLLENVEWAKQIVDKRFYILLYFLFFQINK